MDAIKARNSQTMLKLWRFQPNKFINKVSRDFAAQTREAMLYARNLDKRQRASTNAVEHAHP